MKYDNHWFRYDRRDITLLKSLGYKVHPSVWEIPKSFLEEMIIVDGVIYDGNSEPAPAIENLKELVIDDIPKEFKPIKLGLSARSWRREILPIKGYEINDINDWIKVKKEIKDELLIKQEEALNSQYIPGFTLDIVFLHCFNSDFKGYHTQFIDSSYRKVMLELGVPLEKLS